MACCFSFRVCINYLGKRCVYVIWLYNAFRPTPAKKDSRPSQANQKMLLSQKGCVRKRDLPFPIYEETDTKKDSQFYFFFAFCIPDFTKRKGHCASSNSIWPGLLFNATPAPPLKHLCLWLAFFHFYFSIQLKLPGKSTKC